MTTPPFARQLITGQSHAQSACATGQLLAHVDPLLLARKGILYLPCAPDVSQDALRGIVDSYYGDSSHDVVPSLARALTDAYTLDADLSQRLPLAVVVQGSELYGLGTAQASLWLAHRNQARSLLVPWTDVEGQTAGPWQMGRWRLMINDLVLLGDLGLLHLGAKRLRKLATSRRSPDDLARAVSRASAEGRGERPAVMVLLVPGFSPTDALGHQVAAPPASDAAPLRDSSQRSPIWTALLLAVVMVGAALAISRPALTKENAIGMVAWMLTPMPTETSAPTATPTQPAEMPPEYQTAVAQATALAVERAAPFGTRVARDQDTPASAVQSSTGDQQETSSTAPPEQTRDAYPLPKLLYPGRDQNVHPTYLTMSWEWDGELGEDEYFDVRLWLLGGEKQGIAWTKQPQYIKRATDGGWHSWTVVVIRGRDGVVLEELSGEPQPINFDWSVRGKADTKPVTAPTSIPTPAQPTRIAPTGQPTRVPPGDN